MTTPNPIKGLTWGQFKNDKGADIRYAHAVPDGVETKGRVVMVTGFRESIEKYYEAAQDMLNRGFEVYLMDWRGQGGSSRYLPDTPHKSHHQGYDEQISTLHTFTQTIIPKSDRPTTIMAHSMGGHIALRYLSEHPGFFNSAMLTAPMLDIQTGILPKPLARQIAKFAKAGNYLDKFIPGGHEWLETDHVFDKNELTSDETRFKRWISFLSDNPLMQMGDATYGWVYETFRSIDVLHDEAYLKKINVPVLMQSSSLDQVVFNPAQERAAGLIPDCRFVQIEGAKHEIWQERDELRNKWLAAIDAFIPEKVVANKPNAKKPSAHKPQPPKAA